MMRRNWLLGVALIAAVQMAATSFAAGPPFTPPGPPRPVPAPLPEEACTQVPELCQHR